MPSHKIKHLSWWNEGRNHTIYSREMPRKSDKTRKKAQLQVRFWPSKRRGPPGRTGLFLKFNYQTKVSRKNNPNYWSLLPHKRPKEYPCQAWMINKRFHGLKLRLKMLTCHWDLANNWPRYCTSTSDNIFVWFSWWAQKSVEKRQPILNSQRKMCPPLPLLKRHLIGRILSREPCPTPPEIRWKKNSVLESIRIRVDRTLLFFF